jgi:hypothetical protein
LLHYQHPEFVDLAETRSGSVGVRSDFAEFSPAARIAATVFPTFP